MRCDHRQGRRRSRVLAGVSLLLAMCSDDSRPPEKAKPKETGAVANTPTASEPKAQAGKAPDPSTRAEPGQPPKPAGDPAANPSETGALVDAILAPGLTHLDPDQMEARFAFAKPERARPLDNSLVLLMKNEHGGLKVQFQRSDSTRPWQFSDLELRVLTDATAAREQYEQFSQTVKDRLGKAKWESEQGAYLARGFKMGDEGFDINVGAVLEETQGIHPYAALVVSQPAPGQ